jgi:hypothetical protein
MPTVSTPPAMPGSVKRGADRAHHAEQDDDVGDQRDVRRDPGDE